ncbi:unnamed protein product, partial [Laminaria digitata]
QPDGTVEFLGGSMYELMGYIALNDGRNNDAKERMLQAREVFRDLGIEYQQIAPLLALGDTEGRQGNIAAARQYFVEARSLVDGLDWVDDSQVAIDLTLVEMSLDTRTGEFDKAV